MLHVVQHIGTDLYSRKHSQVTFPNISRWLWLLTPGPITTDSWVHL